MAGSRGTGYLVTLVDRCSCYTLCEYTKTKEKDAVGAVIAQLLSTVPHHYRKTLTLDNGTEFMCYEDVERSSKLDVFFAYPYPFVGTRYKREHQRFAPSVVP